MSKKRISAGSLSSPEHMNARALEVHGKRIDQPSSVDCHVFQAAKKENVLEMFIYGQIGQSWYDDGVGAADVAKALKEAGKIDRIALRLNSPGGSVFEGAAIFTQLKAAGVPIDVRVDGLAASAAFTIAMAGDTVEVGEAAMMMLHNAWGIAMGEADDMRKEADLLDKISQQMAGIYAARSGQALEDVIAMMKVETWLGPQDAVDKGFANAIVKSKKDESAKALAAKFDLSLFARHVPEILQVEQDDACTCPCPSCLGGNCVACTTVDCDYAGCDHDDDGEDMSTSAAPQAGAAPAVVEPPATDPHPQADLSLYERRLRLAGHNL